MAYGVLTLFEIMSEWRTPNPFHESTKQAERAIWSFYDQYKASGEGKALSRPEISSFQHISDESKLRDQKLLTQKKNRKDLSIQHIDGPDAFAFENFLTTEAIAHRWFGGSMSPTTDYDDWISGADAYVEWQANDGQPVRMAIDFTTTDKYRVFTKKSEKLEKNCQIKYLRSRIESEEGRSKELSASMPMVILGAEEKTFKLIAEQGKELTDRHPLRRLLIDQAIAQISLQRDMLGERCVQIPDTNELDLSVFSQKELKRYNELRALYQCLEKEKIITDTIELDPVWRKNTESSITQSVLST